MRYMRTLTESNIMDSSRDRFTQIPMHNDEGIVTGAALKQWIVEWLQYEILRQMHKIN